MSVSRLVRTFSSRESVPIDVNDVVQSIKDRDVIDEIWFWEADIDDDVLRGKIKHWEYPDEQGRIVRCADIDYARSLTTDWQRIVCCKELLHILDPESFRIALPEEIHHLIERIVLPTDLQDPIGDGLGVMSDRVAIYQAVAVLFPYASREILLPLIDAEKIQMADAARLVDLPLRYVKLVLSDLWPKVHDIIVR